MIESTVYRLYPVVCTYCIQYCIQTVTPVLSLSFIYSLYLIILLERGVIRW
jgi:hypothetical protein